MMTELCAGDMVCPTRRSSGVFIKPVTELPDRWREDGTCSYCGSLRPEEFLDLAQSAGVLLVPTDKQYKVYIRRLGGPQRKFYFEHLSEEERETFRDLLRQNRLALDYPGFFYVAPFFLTPGDFAGLARKY